MKERLDVVYDDNLTSTRAIGSLSVALEEAEEMSLRLVDEVDRATIVGPASSCDWRCSRRSPDA